VIILIIITSMLLRWGITEEANITNSSILLWFFHDLC